MNRMIMVSIGDFMDRHSILSIKHNYGLDVNSELDQYNRECPQDEQYDMFMEILYSVNNQLWLLEDMKRKGVERYSQEESDVAFMITSLNDLRHETKKRVDLYFKSDITEKKSH